MRTININDEFTLSIFPNISSSKRAVIAKWSKPFSMDLVDTSKHYHFQFLLDISGSMDTSISSSHLSKISIVKNALIESLEIFRKAIIEGLNIAITLITFNSSSKIIYSNFNVSDSDINVIKHIIQNIHCSGSTCTDLAINNAIESFNPSFETIRILLSDGYHNGSTPRESIIEKFPAFCDKSIAIGNAEDYDIDFLSALSKEGIVNGGLQTEQIMDFIVDSLFGPISNVASDLSLEFDGSSTISSNILINPSNPRQINIPQFLVYQTIFFIINDDVKDIVINYKRLSDNSTNTDVIDSFNSGSNDDLPSDSILFNAIQEIINMNSTVEHVNSIHDIEERKGYLEEKLDILRRIKPSIPSNMSHIILPYLDNYINSLSTIHSACRADTLEEFNVQCRNVTHTTPHGRNASASRQMSLEYSASPSTSSRAPRTTPNPAETTPLPPIYPKFP